VSLSAFFIVVVIIIIKLLLESCCAGTVKCHWRVLIEEGMPSYVSQRMT